MSRCDAIAEALVTGDPLSAEDRAHVDECAACQTLTALPAMLAVSSRPEPPRPGFSARMMAAARERMAQRRRRRFATFTFALAAAGAGAVAVDRTFIRDRVRTADTSIVVPGGRGHAAIDDGDPLSALESFQELDHVVDWKQIEAPLDETRKELLRYGGPK